MSNFDPNTVLGLLRGKLGGLVFVRTRNGKMHVRHAPVREAAFTVGEVVTQSRFKAALAYVTAIRQDPEQYAPYKAAARLSGKRACDLANADFRCPPSITDVDLGKYFGGVNDRIGITADDDFEVARVLVTVAALNGTVLEHGTAESEEPTSAWSYAGRLALPPGQAIIVHVTALDRPGNTAIKSLHHVPGASV